MNYGAPKTFLLTFLSFLIFSLLIAGHEGHKPRCPGPSKLFVFGDSYADTGNNRKSGTSSWQFPYGITFPGKPTGRYSSGRILTDFLASFLGLESPIPYKWRKHGGDRLKYGMNFAHGGTGVFDTLALEPNMTTQIQIFEELVNEAVYAKHDLVTASLALVTLSGNDYSTYFAKGGTAQDVKAFIIRVVNQLALNLKRIHDMGVVKVAVANLEPLGCLPLITAISSFKKCNETQNTFVSFHNFLLQQAVAKLNNESNGHSFVILDLYSSFTTILQNKGDHLGNLKFKTPLKPCCMALSNGSCGTVNEKGDKMYTLCSNPESSFFWDTVHPTQAGWNAVSLALQATMKQIFWI